MVQIYGTLGPACSDAETLARLFEAGMTGVRLNLSHVGLPGAAEQLERLHAAARQCGVTPQLLIDMQGPELRVGLLPAPLTLEFQQQLNKIEHACTIFIVAYRISSIKDADLILVLNDGKIVEQGTHDTLLHQNGYYATVFRHQYGDYERYIGEMNQTTHKGGSKHGTK